MLNRQTLEAVFRGIRTSFNLGLSDTSRPLTYQKWARTVTSTTKMEFYAWLGAIGSLREWVGSKAIEKFDAKRYELINKKFERTIEIDKDDVEDNMNLVGYGEQAMRLGAAARIWPEEQIYQRFNEGFSPTKGKCYTGKSFFATNHRIAGKDFSNRLAVDLSAETAALADASIGLARTMMRESWDDSGRPIDVIPKSLLVPPALESVATKLYKADILEDESPNPYQGMFEPHVQARLTHDAAWFLIGEAGPMDKPMLWQVRREPRIEEMRDVESVPVFMDNVCLVSVTARGVAGYGAPQLAVGSIPG